MMMILMMIMTAAYVLVMGLFGLSHAQLKRMKIDFHSGEVTRYASLLLAKRVAIGSTMVYVAGMLFLWWLSGLPA